MIDNTNRMEVAREAVKHIYIARLMMCMVCHSTGCSGCPFHNSNTVPSCFFAMFNDAVKEYPQLKSMMDTAEIQAKHSKPIKEVGKEHSTDYFNEFEGGDNNE